MGLYRDWDIELSLFISQDVALSHGLTDKEAAVTHFRKLVSEGAGVVVAWGEQGAACHSPDHGLVTCDAHPPPGGVLDTLGAGDTFNAATIGCLASGLSLAQSVEIGCKVRQMDKSETN